MSRLAGLFVCSRCLMDPDIRVEIRVDVLGLDNMKRLGSAINGLKANLEQVTKAGDSQKGMWEQLRKRLDDIETKYDAVFRAGFRLQALGQDLNRMGQAGIGVLKSSVDQWGDFEFSLHRAAGALSIWDTKLPIFTKLREGIYKVAQEARLFPAEDVAKAVYYWGSTTGQVVETQQDLDVVMRGLIPIMKSAAITETDYQVAIKGTYSILQQYGLGLDRAGEVTEKLMLITQRTAAEYPDLINTFKMVGPLANSLGISFEEVVRYTGLIADAGIKGTTTGRGLRQTFIKLVDPTARATKALDFVAQSALHTNKSFHELIFPNGKFIGFTGYINLLAKAMMQMNDAQKNQLLGVITTQAELPVLTTLIDKQISALKRGTNALDDNKYSLDGYHQQFENTFHLLDSSWKGIVGLWTNSVIPIIHEIGSTTAAMLAPVVIWFAKAAQAVNDFLVSHKGVTEWIVRIIAAVSALLVAAGSIFIFIGSVIALGAGIGFLAETVSAFFEVVTGKAGEAAGAVAKAGEAVGGVSGKVGEIVNHASQFVTKLGRFGGAIGLVATVMLTNFGGIRDAVVGLMSLLSGFGGFVVDVFAQAQRTYEFFTTGFGAALTVLDKVIRAVIDAVKSFLSHFEVTASDSKKAASAISVLSSALGILLGVALAYKTAITVLNLTKTAVFGLKDAFVAMIAQRGAILGMLKSIMAMSGMSGLLALLSAGFDMVTAAIVGMSVAEKASVILLGLAVAVAALTAAIAIGSTVVNNFAMDFGDMGDRIHQIADQTGKDYNDVKEQIKSLMSEQNLSFDEASAKVEKHIQEQNQLHDSFLYVGDATAVTTDSLKALSDDGQAALEDLRSRGEEITPEIMEQLKGVGDTVTYVNGKFETAEWGETIAGKLAIAAQDARLAAAAIPTEIAQGILDGRDAVVQAATLAGKAATDSLINQQRIEETRTKAKEASDALAQAMKDGTPGAQAAAKAQYTQAELELAGYLARADPKSKEAAAIFKKYLSSEEPATAAAAEAVYSAISDEAFIAKNHIEAYAQKTGMAMPKALELYRGAAALQAELSRQGISRPIEALVGEFQNHGEMATKALSDAITHNAYLAGTATGDVKKDAEAELKRLQQLASDYGYNTGTAYADGIRAARVEIGRAAADAMRAAQRIMEAASPPKSPDSPLHKIDVWGYRTMRAWGDGARRAYDDIRDDVSHVMSGASNELSSFSSSADSLKSGYSLSLSRDNRAQLDVNVNVTSDGNLDRASSEAIASAIQRGLMLDRLEHIATVG